MLSSKNLDSTLFEKKAPPTPKAWGGFFLWGWRVKNRRKIGYTFYEIFLGFCVTLGYETSIATAKPWLLQRV